MQPPRKCRRTINYAAQQNVSDEESSDDHDSDDVLPISDKDHTSDYEDESDNGYGSESEASNKEASSEAEYKPSHRHKGTPTSTKSIPRTVNHPTTPAKHILRAASKAPSAARKDSGRYGSTSSQATPSRSGSKATPTLAEQKPWVPQAQLHNRPYRGSPENKPWVPAFSYEPVLDYENGNNADDDGGAEADSDDDSDNDYDGNDENDDNDEYEAMTGRRLDPMSLLRTSDYSIMDPRNPYSTSNFRSCMEGLPVDDSNNKSGGKTSLTKKGGRRALYDEDSASESESSEYTGEDGETDDHDQEDM